MRGGAIRGGLVAALAMGVIAGGSGVASAASGPDPTGDLFVRRPGRDRGTGGHRGKPHRDGKPAKRRNRLHVSRRVKRAHRKARRA